MIFFAEQNKKIFKKVLTNPIKYDIIKTMKER